MNLGADGLTATGIVRALGSAHDPTRLNGLAQLQTFLEAQTEMSAADMRKLWKGIFYAVWHADGPVYQVVSRSRAQKDFGDSEREGVAEHGSILLQTVGTFACKLGDEGGLQAGTDCADHQLPEIDGTAFKNGVDLGSHSFLRCVSRRSWQTNWLT